MEFVCGLRSNPMGSLWIPSDAVSDCPVALDPPQTPLFWTVLIPKIKSISSPA